MTTTAAPAKNGDSAESPTARRVIALLTLVVVLSVFAVLYLVTPASGPRGTGPDVLATINALLNGSSAVLLCTGFVFIRSGRIEAHRACMVAAFASSSVFLVTYLLHHARVGSVKFQGTGFLRVVYFGVLVPHVILAAAIVPLALVTLRRGWVRDVARHRAIARVTLPLWLYVSVTGVVIYVLLYQVTPGG